MVFLPSTEKGAVKGSDGFENPLGRSKNIENIEWHGLKNKFD